MDALSTDPLARARKIQSTILQALAGAESGADLAAITGLSESKVSRLKNDHLGDFAAMLAALGLKVVSVNLKCIREDEYQFLYRTSMPELARRANTPELDWSGVE